MAFRKAVLAKSQHLLIQPLGEFLRVAARAHPADQLLAKMLDAAAALPGAHRAAQRIRFPRRKARRRDGELHHLLLEDRHAESALQDSLDLAAGIAHR